MNLERRVDAIVRDGYTVLECVLEPELVDALADDLLRLEAALDVRPAGNSFEGDRKIRIYKITAAGRKQLQREISAYERMLAGISRVMRPAES